MKVSSVSITVDYSRSLKEMVRIGNYRWVSSFITEKNYPFPSELKGQKKASLVRLFHLNRTIGSKEAIAEMEKVGYRPANLAELLAIGEIYPELQKDYPIVTLDLVWRNGRGALGVPVLSFCDSRRGLSIYSFDSDWSYQYRFLAVLK